MAGVRTLIQVPRQAKRGEILTLRLTIRHPMETGLRPDGQGGTVPHNLITHFRCRYDGVEVFASEWFPAIAANPQITFTTVATASGTLEFHWEGDQGFSHTEAVTLEVT